MLGLMGSSAWMPDLVTPMWAVDDRKLGHVESPPERCITKEV